MAEALASDTDVPLRDKRRDSSAVKRHSSTALHSMHLGLLQEVGHAVPHSIGVHHRDVEHKVGWALKGKLCVGAPARHGGRSEPAGERRPTQQPQYLLSYPSRSAASIRMFVLRDSAPPRPAQNNIATHTTPNPHCSLYFAALQDVWCPVILAPTPRSGQHQCTVEQGGRR